MTKSLPLRLKELVFPRISVQALVPREGQERLEELSEDDISVEFHFNLADEGKAVNCLLRLKTKYSEEGKAEKIPSYALEFEAFAHFEVMLPQHQDERAQWFRRNASATTLIGAVREQIANSTARGPWGTAMMPIINLGEIIGRLPPPPEAQKIAVLKDETKPAPKRKPRLKGPEK